MNFTDYLRRKRHHVISRISLAVILSLSAGATLLAGSPASAEEQLAATTPTNFVARDATRYSENPNLAKYGLKDITVLYEGSLWPSGADRTQPDRTYIYKYVIPKLRWRKPDAIVIDIERWSFSAGMTSAQITENINKYKKVLSLFRRELPNTKLGLYSMLPERNWNAPCGDPKKSAARTATWHERNMQLQPLADAVDIILPSLYTIYEDPKSVACWPAYAEANIAEAKSYGKPVWAFLWMKNKVSDTWIPAEFWRQQLETVYSHADGMVLWSMASANDKWSWTAPWWVETAAFLKAKGLAQ